MNRKYYATSAQAISELPLPAHDEIRKNDGQPYYLICRNGKIVARVWIDDGDKCRLCASIRPTGAHHGKHHHPGRT